MTSQISSGLLLGNQETGGSSDDLDLVDPSSRDLSCFSQRRDDVYRSQQFSIYYDHIKILWSTLITFLPLEHLRSTRGFSYLILSTFLAEDFYVV